MGKIYVCVRVRVCWEGGGGEIVSSLGLWEYNRHMHHPSFPPSPLPPPPYPPLSQAKTGCLLFKAKRTSMMTHTAIFPEFSLNSATCSVSYLHIYIYTYIHTYLTALLVFCFFLFFFLANGGPQALSKDVSKSLLIKYSVEV